MDLVDASIASLFCELCAITRPVRITRAPSRAFPPTNQHHATVLETLRPSAKIKLKSRETDLSDEHYRLIFF